MATLSVQDVIDRVQRTFGDEAAVQVTQADILRWINDAQREAVMQNEGLLQTIGFVDLVQGQTDYDLPDNCFTLSHVFVKSSTSEEYYTLKVMTLRDLAEQSDGWMGSAIDAPYPIAYTTQQTGKLTVFPKPQASVAQGIKMLYSRYANEVTTTADPIDLPPYYGTFVINYCLMQAYEMDEDWESSSQKATQVQGDLDFNNNRQFWFGRDSYPTISAEYEDI